MSRLKVLQVGSALPGTGGIEKFILNLSNGLRNRDVLVHITAIPHSWLWREAHEQGFDVIPMRVGSQHDFRALIRYMRLLRTGRYDIVNTHYSPDYIVPAIAARLVGGQKMVLTRHLVLRWKGLKPWMYGTVLYHGIIAVSDAVRDRLVISGITEASVGTVHSGVATQTSAVSAAPLRQELSLPEDTFLIGVMARLSPEKGHATLITAMLDVDPRAVCIIGGAGSNEARLRSMVRDNGLDSRIKFLGWREDSDAVIESMDIVVQPSYGEEACSTSILEAMALGKPLVVTRVGGNSELVEQNVSGLVVPKEDPVALAAALNALVRDAGLRQQMGSTAASRQRRDFTIERMAEGTERAYRRLLKA